MVGLVALWMVAQTPTQFEKLFPHPTGHNGLEEYAQAGDLLKTGHFNLYQAWLPPEKRPTPEQLRQDAEDEKKAIQSLDENTRKLIADDEPPPSAEETRLTDHLNTLSFLEVKREEASQFGAALDLIADGNRKPISFPDPGNGPSFGFDWLSGLKAVTKLASDASYAAFSEGNPDRGVAILDECLIMAHRIGDSNLIGQLVGIAAQAIVLARFNEQMDALPLDEAREVERLVGQLLADTDALPRMVRNEERSQLGDLAWMVKASQKDHTFTPDQAATIEREAGQYFAEQAAVAGALFERPEDEWLAGSEPASDQDVPDLPKTPTPEQYLNFIRSLGSPTTSHQAVLVMLRTRAQLRLLRLHAKIREYRWQNGRLPESLDALGLTKDESYDPLSQKPFHYEVKDGAYRVYSLGIPETGIIELRYRRPQNAGSDDGVGLP